MIILAVLAVFTTDRCSVINDLDDQSPKLIVDVDITAMTGTIDSQHQIYLIYYNKSDWTEPWLQHGSESTSLFNPVVLNINTYVAVFWDKNGNQVLDSGDPYTGYQDVDNTGKLTIVPFLPSLITHLNMSLSDSRTWL